ncbi:BNR-4 repeat-containing protein [Actinospongicola halichondriae]|uniref:BNR-4 repeat-containing protein n=1 Tax=Actinospongicola halichondriae TaxID=3236844 RepID=UPI003D5B551A
MSRARPVRRLAAAAVIASLLSTAVVAEHGSAADAPSGFAGGSITELNPSGAWSWFEGPRAIHTDCELLVGSVSATGMIDVSTMDLSTRSTRVDHIGGPVEIDDHNSPGLVELPDGRISAAWSRHNKDRTVRNVERPASMWNWYQTPSVLATQGVTYSNLVRLAGAGVDEETDQEPAGRLYNFFRGDGYRTIFSTSDDLGRTWSTPSTLLRKQSQRPYPVYDDDGESRIDVATTEGHPREYAPGTSVYHGFIEDGAIRRSDGSVIADEDFGIAPEELTLVYERGEDERAWTLDVITPTETSPATIVLSVRDLGDDVLSHQRNRYLYATWNGDDWVVNPLAWAGDSLYEAEEFYTGGVALDPTDPTHVVLSTNVDPTTGLPLVPAVGRTVAAHELYDGFTADGGASWTFQPITVASTESNLRPVIADPGSDARSLVWLQGTYVSYRQYATRVVGIVEGTATGPCPTPLATDGAEAFAGDFDGDGLTDWLDYRPGSAPDVVHWGDGDRTVTSVNGQYRPQVRRVADGRDEIFWANPAASYRWVEQGHQFVSSAIRHAANVELLVGDFDGDGLDDVFHYRPGTESDRIYWTDGTSTPLRVNGVYRPIVGDFNGDDRDDLLWYAPGGAADYYWRFDPGHRWTSFRTGVSGQYEPAVGDIDGDGTDDVFWRRSTGGGYQWLHAVGAIPQPTSFAVG